MDLPTVCQIYFGYPISCPLGTGLGGDCCCLFLLFLTFLGKSLPTKASTIEQAQSMEAAAVQMGILR